MANKKLAADKKEAISGGMDIARPIEGFKDTTANNEAINAAPPQQQTKWQHRAYLTLLTQSIWMTLAK